MTLRESFAMAALQGLLANPDLKWNCQEAAPFDEIARLAVAFADAAIEKLEKTKQ